MKLLIRIGLLALVGLVLNIQAVEVNKVLKEQWDNVGGGALANNDWTLTPDIVSNIDSFEIAADTGSNYAVRLTAEVTIPTTGAYTFYVACDDQGDLKLSTNNNQAELFTIASVDEWASYQQWDKFPTQQSTTYNFTAGQKILLSARMKEAVGGDNLSVGWSIDGGATTVIPASVCTAPDTGPVSPVEVVEPLEAVVLFEKWDCLSSDNLATFDFTATPIESSNLTTFEIIQNTGTNYMSRMTAIVKVPKTGAYTFYSAADDKAKLFISTDGIIANVAQVAENTSAVSSQIWTQNTEQKSQTFNLIAGQSIAIQMTHKEASGDDHATAGWSIDGGAIEVILGKYDEWLTSDSLQIDTPATSQVSPAWIEGRVGAVSNSVQVTIDSGTAFNADLMGTTRFFANNSATTKGVTLNATAATAVSITNGVNTVNQSITWSPTDIATANDITIRKGDSLLLTANGPGLILEIDTDWQSSEFTTAHVGVPGQNFVQTFNTAGTFIISAQIDLQLTESITVTVVDASFDGDSIACEIGYNRKMPVNLINGDVEDLTFTTSYKENLSISLSEWSSNGLLINIQPNDFSNESAAIRINGENGPILDIKEVEEFTLTSQASQYIGVVEEFIDGSVLVQTNLEMLDKISGLQVDLHVFVSGVTFEDGTLDKMIMTDAFDSSSPALHAYKMIMNDDVITGPCHTIKVYQNNVQIGD